MQVPTVRVKSWHPSQGDFVEINKADFDSAKHTLFEPRPAPRAAAVPPPPPPPPADPLDHLPREWKGGKTKELIALAASVTGRTPENREQAIALIEAAIAARAAQ